MPLIVCNFRAFIGEIAQPMLQHGLTLVMKFPDNSHLSDPIVSQ